MKVIVPVPVPVTAWGLPSSVNPVAVMTGAFGPVGVWAVGMATLSVLLVSPPSGAITEISATWGPSPPAPSKVSVAPSSETPLAGFSRRS